MNVPMVQYLIHQMQPLHPIDAVLECNRAIANQAYVDRLYVRDRQSSGIENDIFLPNVLCTAKLIPPADFEEKTHIRKMQSNFENGQKKIDKQIQLIYTLKLSTRI